MKGGGKEESRGQSLQEQKGSDQGPEKEKEKEAETHRKRLRDHSAAEATEDNFKRNSEGFLFFKNTTGLESLG